MTMTMTNTTAMFSYQDFSKDPYNIDYGMTDSELYVNELKENFITTIIEISKTGLVGVCMFFIFAFFNVLFVPRNIFQILIEKYRSERYHNSCIILYITMIFSFYMTIFISVLIIMTGIIYYTHIFYVQHIE